MSERFRIALAGNPNSGKTTTFNALTGARQHVGNYAGVTVEKREGVYEREGREYDVVDLPGTYSLTSYSPEERIAQNELLNGKFDVVVVVVDSTALKRSLVFMAQLMQLNIKIVLSLNMSDEAEKIGQRINLQLFRDLLGFPVVETASHKRVGVDDLKAAIDQAVAAPVLNSRLVLGERMDAALDGIGESLAKTALPPVHRRWIATKLLLQDPTFVEKLASEGTEGRAAIESADRWRSKLEAEYGTDVALFTMERYYGFVDGLLREVTIRHAREDARALSDKVDSILVNRLMGVPFFLGVMYIVFWLTFSVREIPMGWIEGGFGLLGDWLNTLWPAGSDSALRSLLVDGVIGGVGGVVVFVPNIVLLFLCLSLLEDTGYMARGAFLVDRLMHRFGLHGRSFIPMMTGFGCSIPGIMATRTLENDRDRLTTMLVLPLMSCGARLPIWMLLIPAFFAAKWRAPVLWLIYMTGIILALVLARFLRSSILKGDQTPFVMELPPYRLPTARAVVTKMAERSWIYLRKAGTVILAISIIMWVLTSYPKPQEATVDKAIAGGTVQLVKIDVPSDATDALKEKKFAAAMELARKSASSSVELISVVEAEKRRSAEALHYSFAGRLGRAIEPAIRPLGFDWKIGTALLGSFAAKEVFVSQMGIIYSLGEADEDSQDLRTLLGKTYSPLVGFSLMLFLLIATPCMATVAITRRESGSWKWAMLQMGGLTFVAYLISLAFFQIGQLVT